VKEFKSGGLRQKSSSRSEAVPFPTSFGIRGLAQRRGSTFLPVSKTFSTRRFPRNTERVIGEYRDKGNVLRGGVVQSFDTPRIIFCTKVKFYSIKLSIHSFIIPNVFSRNSSVVSGRIGHIRNAR